MLDSMDVLVQQLQAQQKGQEQAVAPQQSAQQVTTQQQAEQPQQQVSQQPLKSSEELEREIDELLKMANEAPKPTEVKQEPAIQEKKVPDFIKKQNDQPLTVDELEEINKYITELEDEKENIIFESRKTKIERDQYEQMWQKEQQRSIEVADRVRSLEWELKQHQANQFPDELKNLGDYFRLNKEKPNNYVKGQLVGETVGLLEQLTNVPGDRLIEYRLMQQGGNSGLSESSSAGLDFIPQPKDNKQAEKDNYLQKVAF